MQTDIYLEIRHDDEYIAQFLVWFNHLLIFNDLK